MTPSIMKSGIVLSSHLVRIPLGHVTDGMVRLPPVVTLIAARGLRKSGTTRILSPLKTSRLLAVRSVKSCCDAGQYSAQAL